MRTLFLGFLAASWLFGAGNFEIAQKNDAAMKGFGDAVASMRMTLINAGGQKNVRQLQMQTLEKEGGDKSLMEFLSPADVKGTKFLSYEHAERDDDQWLYLPALKRVKRIASRNKSGSFMGSEFSYEDLGSFNIEKYTYPGVAEETQTGDVHYYVTTRIPKSKDSGYTKQRAWIDAKDYLTHKVEYYDRKKELLKTATFGPYRKIKGVWRISSIVMVNHQNGKSTELVWEEERIKTGLREKDFHKRVLKK